jgi:adenylate cyclase
MTTRRLAAILAADVAGFSALMELDEEGTFARIGNLRREVIEPRLSEHQGRLIKTTGDGFLVEFASPLAALRCALAIQANLTNDRDALRLRIGLNLGDVIIEEGGDVYGEGVNVAARLEGLADPGGILISDKIHREVEGKVEAVFENRGEQQVKNISRPIHIYAVHVAGSQSATAAAFPDPAKPLALPDKPSIAVLPFQNMSGDPEQEYFADGMVEDIITALSRVRSFFVIARNSSFIYKGKAVDIKQVGRELGVRYVLEGSVRKSAQRIRITGQLIDAQTGAHIWADRFEGGIEDIFDLQDRITEQVAGALQPSIRIAEIERSRRKRPQDLSAYDYAMRAMPHVWALEKEESSKALELLDKAMAIDPKYPLALSLAGWCHAQRSVYNWAEDEDIAESQALALKLAERAAELSGDDPLILAVLGAVHTFVRNHGTARVLLERALALDPNAAWAWSRLGWLENYSDRPERALENFERALRLSPLDPMNFNNYVGMGSAHEVAQDYDKAATFYRRALEERPHAMWIYRNLASSLSGAGRMEEAKKAYVEMTRSYPGLTASKFKQAMVFSAPVLDRMVDNLRKLGLPD